MSFFQTTRFKIKLVRWLSRPIVLIFRIFQWPILVKVRRGGINWELDLNEAIDFCLWLTSDYEPELNHYIQSNIKAGDIVIDIGANIGVHTLRIAQMVGATGHVFAIEATEWAYHKLKKQLALNPELGKRVTPIHAFLLGHDDQAPTAVSASWSVKESIDNPQRNELDQGLSKNLENAMVKTLDELILSLNLSKLNYIKLDVDGHEVSVLKGATKTFDKFAPKVLMELSPIHYDQHHKYKFRDQIDFFLSRNYQIINLANNRILPSDAGKIEEMIPYGVLENVIAQKK
jgi:FkbM family methyltransferase